MNAAENYTQGENIYMDIQMNDVGKYRKQLPILVRTVKQHILGCWVKNNWKPVKIIYKQ